MSGLTTDRAFFMLMIGKLYQNYAAQHGLFLFFSERALEDLNSGSRGEHSTAEYEDGCKAIAHDSLGQYYTKFGDYEQAMAHFREAKAHARRASRPTTLSRALAHEASCSALRRGRVEESDLSQYRHAIDMVMSQRDIRGQAVRYLGYARLLEAAGRGSDALPYVLHALRLSRQVSDDLTTIRARLLQAKLEDDPHKGLVFLQKAQRRAEERELLRLQLDSNRAIIRHLAEYPAVNRSNLFDAVVEAIRRHTRTFIERTASIHQSLDLSADSTSIEFIHLEQADRERIRSALLNDLRLLVSSSTDDSLELARLISKERRRAIDEAGIMMGGLMSRAILHDIGWWMQPREIRPWRDALDLIESSLSDREDKALAGSIRLLREMARSHETLVSRLDDLKRAASQPSGDTVELESVIQQVIQRMIDDNVISLTDVEINIQASTKFAAGLPIERVIENLLRNAALHATGTGHPRLKVTFDTRHSGDVATGNRSSEFVLRIFNRANPDDVEQLLSALANPGSTTDVDGTGTGVLLTDLVFRTLLRGKVMAYHQDGFTVIELVVPRRGGQASALILP